MTFEAFVQGFGCVPNPTPYEQARAVVLPTPLEPGGSEIPGVGLGPLAVLGASRFVETYDGELGFDPLEAGVATLDALRLRYDTLERPYEQIESAVREVLHHGKLPLCVGGERTIALGAARACRAVHGEVGVVLFTRRPGLCDEAEGRRIAPSTIGRRLSEEHPCCFLGARTWTEEEARSLSSRDAPPVATARSLEDGQTLPDECTRALPRKVHLSIDVGVLDPAVLPIPGNIEPGGLRWFSLTSLIDQVFDTFEVVACDVSGFAPALGDLAPGVLVAELVLRCLGRGLESSQRAVGSTP